MHCDEMSGLARGESPRTGRRAGAGPIGALVYPRSNKGAGGNANVKELVERLAPRSHSTPTTARRFERPFSVAATRQQRTGVCVVGASALVVTLKTPEVHSLLAIERFGSGKVAEALVVVRASRAPEPNNPERLTNWGTTLMLNSDVQRYFGVSTLREHRSSNKRALARDLGTALLSTNDIAGALPHLCKTAHELRRRRRPS